jgi:hypothetical protein
MADDYEINEDELEENEVLFFKCKDCGSRALDAVNIIEVTQIIEKVLPCQCGEEENAAYIRNRIVKQVQKSGYLARDRHVFFDETETLDELDREIEDEQVICGNCYEKYKDEQGLWHDADTFEDEDIEGSDLTINCNGCGREIEFGCSHANKQGRVFLGDEDSDFNPCLTFQTPNIMKYGEKGGGSDPKNNRVRFKPKIVHKRDS